MGVFGDASGAKGASAPSIGIPDAKVVFVEGAGLEPFRSSSVAFRRTAGDRAERQGSTHRAESGRADGAEGKMGQPLMWRTVRARRGKLSPGGTCRET